MVDDALDQSDRLACRDPVILRSVSDFGLTLDRSILLGNVQSTVRSKLKRRRLAGGCATENRFLERDRRTGAGTRKRNEDRIVDARVADLKSCRVVDRRARSEIDRNAR